MTTLGHSRKLHLRIFLALIQDAHPVSELKVEATRAFGVSPRTVEQAVSDLDDAGLLSRVRAREGDKRRMFVSLTNLGVCAVDDPIVARTLIGLPKLRREHREWMGDPLNPGPARVRLDQWRREMRR